MPPDPWIPSPRAPALASGEVHVWRASLDLPGEVLERLRTALSPEERQRAGRFLFENDRRRFVAARGLLRDILGRYLNRDPATVQFQYGPVGKPALAGGVGPRFNVSHSHEMGLYALALAREVGVDVEVIQPRPGLDQIASRFFAPGEVAALGALPESERIDAFFRCWTRKEAYIKATGEGLRVPLTSFEVSLTPEEPPALRIEGDRPEASRWSLLSIDPGPGYAAALVVEGGSPALRLLEWML